jgi:hypothetical protein
MGKKSQPSPPPPPDPNQIINTEAQANRVNQITPYGSLTYGGPDNNTATLNFSPELQNLFSGQMGISQGVLNQAQQQLGSLPQGNPYAGFGVGNNVPGLQTVSQSQVPLAPQLNNIGITPQSVPGLQTSIPGLGDLQNPTLQRSIGNLDFSGANPLPKNYQGFNQDAANAFYNNSSGLLNQQFSRDQNALDQKLANQGLQSGGAAYNDQINQFLTNKNQTFSNLANQAVLYGGQDASRQLSDMLNLRGAGTNEAQAQFGAGLTQGNFGNQAALSQADANNANQQAIFNAQATAAGFGNQAQTQQFGLGTTAYNQALQNQLFGNDVIQQGYQNQNQQFANQNTAAGQANATRGQAFNEAGTQQNAQFNQLASLLGLQQVQTPQLSSFSPPGSINAIDPYALQQSAQQSNYNTQAGNAGSKKGSMANLGGTLGGAIIQNPGSLSQIFSDRRLKSAIQKIGRYKSYNVYLWVWNKAAEKLGLNGFGLGVLADEVPIYFVSMKNGYLAVDYGAL